MSFREELDKIQVVLKELPETEKNIYEAFTSILEGFNNKLEELEVNLEAIGENVDYLNSDLSDIQEDLFEEVSLEDLEDFDDGFEEVTCSHCKKPIFVDKSALVNNSQIPCPLCGENIK